MAHYRSLAMYVTHQESNQRTTINNHCRAAASSVAIQTWKKDTCPLQHTCLLNDHRILNISNHPLHSSLVIQLFRCHGWATNNCCTLPLKWSDNERVNSKSGSAFPEDILILHFRMTWMMALVDPPMIRRVCPWMNGWIETSVQFVTSCYVDVAQAQEETTGTSLNFNHFRCGHQSRTPFPLHAQLARCDILMNFVSLQDHQRINDVALVQLIKVFNLLYMCENQFNWP